MTRLIMCKRPLFRVLTQGTFYPLERYGSVVIVRKTKIGSHRKVITFVHETAINQKSNASLAGNER